MKKAWILKVNEETIGFFESPEKAWREYYAYARKNPFLNVHRMTCNLASEVSNEDCRKFDDCKNPTEILEMLYFWAADYKECDQPVDPWLVSGKIKEAMIALEKLDDVDF